MKSVILVLKLLSELTGRQKWKLVKKVLKKENLLSSEKLKNSEVVELDNFKSEIAPRVQELLRIKNDLHINTFRR